MCFWIIRFSYYGWSWASDFPNGPSENKTHSDTSPGPWRYALWVCPSLFITLASSLTIYSVDLRVLMLSHRSWPTQKMSLQRVHLEHRHMQMSVQHLFRLLCWNEMSELLSQMAHSQSLHDVSCALWIKWGHGFPEEEARTGNHIWSHIAKAHQFWSSPLLCHSSNCGDNVREKLPDGG